METHKNVEQPCDKKLPGKAAVFGRKAVSNALKFTFNVLFAYVYQVLFGADNILAGVALCVGLTTLPDMDLGIRPGAMAAVIVTLNVGAGFVAQFATLPPAAAFFAYALFVMLILLLSGEPVRLKSSISFLLCFVFCQANPAGPGRLPARILSLAVGSALVAAVTVIQWRRKGYGRNGRTLPEQARLCARRKGYILRSAFGIAAAMTAGMVMGLRRPMWISIAVMSLTQVNLEDTKRRIMYRSMATVFGAAVLAGIMVPFIPREYNMAFILAIGYISFFTTQYKYTQIVNAINALNASLFLLSPEEAVVNRIFCLAIGIVIVLGMWWVQAVVRDRALPQCRKYLRTVRSKWRGTGPAVLEES